jgi:gliding motility-associated-like protein
VDRAVNILGRPSLSVTTSQPICKGDSLRLQARGAGSFAWSPSTGLSNTAVPDPIAFPTAKTRYYVTLSNGPGCQNRDSVDIDVTSKPLLDAGKDTTICLTDTLRLNPSSDGTRFSWQPAPTLDDANARNPLARPAGTTTYVVTAWLGGTNGCSSKDSVKVSTSPYPKVVLMRDTTLCIGDSFVLRASGGTDYRWSPSTGLSDSNLPNPVAKPGQTTTYRVEVRDLGGCPKPGIDSVRIEVASRGKAYAGRDTSIVTGQPFRLDGSGGGTYLWTPATGLSDPRIANPTVNIGRDQTYILTVTNNRGCSDRDTVVIKVFESAPDIFVPSAFTPNGDGLNDRLTPIPVGIREFQFFRVYNRWGQLVFGADGTAKGWDGRFGGKAQLSQTFAWHARGVGYDGRVVDKKGTTILYR